jgi:hypothetical protein
LGRAICGSGSHIFVFASIGIGNVHGKSGSPISQTGGSLGSLASASASVAAKSAALFLIGGSLVFARTV